MNDVVTHVLGGKSARLDDALAHDVDGTIAAIDDAKARKVPLVLVSTLAAVGAKKGLVAEDDPRRSLFGGGTVRGSDLDVDGELRACRAAVEHALSSSRCADRLSALADETRNELVALGGASTGGAFERAFADALEREKTRAMERVLVERASGWRFATGSTWSLRGYTCALAELLVARSDVPYVIARVPGDVDDTLAWALDRVHAGVLRLPLTGRLEALPKHVVDRALEVIARGIVAQPSAPSAVVHLTSASPLSPARFTDLLDLHLRRRRKGDDDAHDAHDAHDAQGAQGAQGAHATPAAARALSVDTVGTRVPGAELVARGLSALQSLLPSSVASSSIVDETFAAMKSVVDVDGADRARCSAPPFFHDDTRFSQRGLRMFAARAGVDASAGGAVSTDVDWRTTLLDDVLPALEDKRASIARARPKLPRPAYDSLAHLLVEAAARYGSRPALSHIHGDEVDDISYRELLERASAVARRLREAGVKDGDRVVLSAANRPEWGVAAFGAFLARAALVPIDASDNLDVAAVANIVKKARPVCAIVDVGVRRKFGDALPNPTLDLALTTSAGPGLDDNEPLPRPDDVASILFTSGTTGEPKGVQLTHANFAALLASLQSIFPVGRGDRMLSVLPLHHTFEFSCGLLMPLASGARIFTPDALTGERVLFSLKRGQITAMVGIPALWGLLEKRISTQAKERGDVVEFVVKSLLAANRAFGKRTGMSFGRLALKPIHDQLGGHLRTLISGGSALPPGVHDMFQGLGLPLAEGYGLTEAAPVLTVAEGVLGAPAGTVGRAIPGVELRIVDADPKTGVGEVWARAPNVMKGYFENDDATSAAVVDGWLKTGDLGKIDRDGRLRLVGRSKDVVVTATGENIYLDDIEKKLENIDGVDALTLLGVPDTKAGGSTERCALVYVVKPDAARDVVLDAVKARVLKLPAYARPTVVERVDGPLPLTATRKVKRKEVRATLVALLAARAEAAGDTTTTTTAFVAVRKAISDVAGVDVAAVTAAKRMAADFNFDSLMWTELGATLEKLGGKLDPAALVANETVADVEAFVRAAAAANAAPGSAVAVNVGGDDERPAPSHAPLATTWKDVALAFVKPVGRAAITTVQREAYRSVFHADVSGRAFIPHNRNAIVVANHTSHLDTGLVKFALGSYGVDLKPLAAKDYFFEGAAPKVAFFEHFTNLVPIDRETGSGLAFDQARAVVDGGHVVLIFPEGTRREDGTLGEFKPLVARLSLETGVDVLPIWMKGNYEALPRGTHFPNMNARDLEAHIGPPLEAQHMARLTASLRNVERARKATEIIRRAIVALSEGRMLELSRVKSLDELDRGVVARAEPAAG